MIAKKIQHGDEIRVIAPAYSLSTFKSIKIKKALKTLKEMGFKVSFSRNCHKKNLIKSSSIKSRIDDMHAAFKDKKVKMVLCAIAGYNSNEILPYIDWSIIKSNPKIFCGFSDITILVNAIYKKTNLTTYLGPTFSTFSSEKSKVFDYTKDYFKKSLINNKQYDILPSLYFSEKNILPKRNKGFNIIQKGSAQGIIIGGNLNSFNLLQGTSFMPSLKGKVLFIEEDDYTKEHTAEEFLRNLVSLLQQKDSNKIKGIIIGRFQKNAFITEDKLKFILQNRKISKKIPIISNVDFGHTYPNLTVPIGGIISINTNKSKVDLKIIKH